MARRIPAPSIIPTFFMVIRLPGVNLRSTVELDRYGRDVIKHPGLWEVNPPYFLTGKAPRPTPKATGPPETLPEPIQLRFQ